MLVISIWWITFWTKMKAKNWMTELKLQPNLELYQLCTTKHSNIWYREVRLWEKCPMSISRHTPNISMWLKKHKAQSTKYFEVHLEAWIYTQQHPSIIHRESVKELRAPFSHCPTVNLRSSSPVLFTLQHNRRGTCQSTYKSSWNRKGQ